MSDDVPAVEARPVFGSARPIRGVVQAMCRCYRRDERTTNPIPVTRLAFTASAKAVTSSGPTWLRHMRLSDQLGEKSLHREDALGLMMVVEVVSLDRGHGVGPARLVGEIFPCP